MRGQNSRPSGANTMIEPRKVSIGDFELVYWPEKEEGEYTIYLQTEDKNGSHEIDITELAQHLYMRDKLGSFSQRPTFTELADYICTWGE